VQVARDWRIDEVKEKRPRSTPADVASDGFAD
jgi:hypothetical protein